MNTFFQNLLLRFQNLLPIAALLHWAKTTTSKGLEGVMIYDVWTFLWKEINSNNLGVRANAIAFTFFLSIFPSIIVIFSLLAYLPIYKNFYLLIQGTINDIMPGNAGKMVLDSIKDLTTIKRKGLLSFSFFLTFYFASSSMVAMMSGFEKSYKITFHRRGFFQKRLIALQLTILLGFLLIASVLLVILGNTLTRLVVTLIKASWFTEITLFTTRWIVILFLFYGGITLLYRYGAPLRRRLNFINIGATVATFLSLSTSVLFSFYVDNFGTYNKVYGSIGTIIVLMVWLQFNIFIVLFGFELNASIAVNRDLNQLRLYEQSEEPGG